MKIIVEILSKNEFNDYVLDISKTIEFKTGDKATKISKAKTRLQELKSTLNSNQKIRVLEYHNDDSDATRTPCKILYED
jgi:hypothetical protein